ncbi:hypothetical protein ACTMU2_18975 [Cupriavidus basilensis]
MMFTTTLPIMTNQFGRKAALRSARLRADPQVATGQLVMAVHPSVQAKVKRPSPGCSTTRARSIIARGASARPRI